MKGKRTYQPSRKHKHSTHGFRKRMRSRGGKEVLNSRRRKGRHKISVSSPRKGHYK